MGSDDLYSILKLSDSPVLTQFLHECVDDFVKKREANYDNYSRDIEWTLEDFDKTKKYIQNIFLQSIIEQNVNLDSQKLNSHFKKAIKNCFETRRNEIFQALAKEAVLKNGINLVEGIDWKLKWILGSSDLAAMREPLLQVQLHCNRKNDNKYEKNTIDFEADLEQVDSLVEELSRMKKDMCNEYESDDKIK